LVPSGADHAHKPGVVQAAGAFAWTVKLSSANAGAVIEKLINNANTNAPKTILLVLFIPDLLSILQIQDLSSKADPIVAAAVSKMPAICLQINISICFSKNQRKSG
jgi:hypothetical protein